MTDHILTNKRDSLIERYFQTWLQYLAAGRGEFEELRRSAFEAGWTAKETHAVISTPSEPSEGYSQEYADQMRTALLRIAAPVYLNLKPAYADPDNVKAICDGLNERIKIAQDALLGLGKKSEGGQ